MNEYKVIPGTHSLSTVKDNKDYAIVVTTYFVAEPGARRGVYLENEKDMFIIANSFTDACELLNGHITDTIGRKPKR